MHIFLSITSSLCLDTWRNLTDPLVTLSFVITIIASRLLQEVEFLKQGYFTFEEMDTIVSTLNIVGGLDLGIEKCKGARLGEGNIDGLPEGSRQDWIAGGAFDEWPPGSRWKYQSNTQSRDCCPPKERHQVRVPTKHL